ncbi:MAG: hypothetical protein LBP75_03565 [Planctomycetota bacterium]|jgi:hypothetical protein|nr:hypothetical protein [Planctomycetota bacterium]
MKTAEGKIGRVFILHFENGDQIQTAVEKFLAEAGAAWGYVNFLAENGGAGGTLEGAVAPDENGKPRLRWLSGKTPASGKAVIYEIVGLVGPAADAGGSTRVPPPSSPTVVHAGDHTHILTAFNAEFV